MDYTTTDLSGSLGTMDANSIYAIVLGSLWIALVIALIFYVYNALVLVAIAKKTNTQNPWLAWIPFANLYLMTQIAKVPWWTFLVVFLSWIPFVGALAVLAVVTWWWWKISEARQRPGWWALLMLIPGVNLVMMGLLAWTEK